MQLLFSFLLFALSTFACRFEVTVTSVSLPPLMSRRGLFNTNQRLPSPPSKKTTHKIRPKAFSQCDSTKSSDSIQPTYIKLTSDVCLPQLQPPAFLVRAQCPRIAGFMRAQRAHFLPRGFVDATLLAAFLVTLVLVSSVSRTLYLWRLPTREFYTLGARKG